MTPAMLSVIVPIYNTAPWLARCLDSICNQSYQNLEILCVNDGSTDNSAEILEEYAARDSRIRVYTQENAGLSAARNTGLEHASGEWVTGVDSDDFLYPGIYEQVLSYCREGVDMVFFGVRNVAEDGAALPHAAYFNLPEAGEYPMSPELAAGLNVCFVSKFWRRSMLEENKLRFPVGLVHEDEAMYCLAAPYVRRIAICPVEGYAYMQRTGSIMRVAGLDALKRAERYTLLLEYIHAEYEHRGLLNTSAFEYLESTFVRICGPCYQDYKKENSMAIQQMMAGMIQNCRMTGVDYRLERFVPVQGWRRLFLSRYQCAKVYRFFGIPVWMRLYTPSGRRLTLRVLLEHLQKRWFRS